jgi:hypothetical protein
LEDEMISDQTIVCTRAEKQKSLGRRAFREILTASMAAVSTLASLAAWASDGPRETTKSRKLFEAIALLPIPYLDAMPRLTWNGGVNS